MNVSFSNGTKKFFCHLQRPDRLCDQPSFLFNGYRGLYPLGQSSRATHLNLVASLRMSVALPLFLYSWRVYWLCLT